MVTKARKMSENREYSALRRAIARVDDIYSCAKSFYLTHDEIAEKVVKEVFEHTSMKRATKATSSYIHGYCEAKRNEVYRYHVKWMMWVMSIDGLSGELMSREEIDALTKREMSSLYLPKDYRSPISRVNSDKSRHVWMRDGVGLKMKPYDIKWKGEPYCEMSEVSVAS